MVGVPRPDVFSDFFYSNSKRGNPPHTLRSHLSVNGEGSASGASHAPALIRKSNCRLARRMGAGIGRVSLKGAGIDALRDCGVTEKGKRDEKGEIGKLFASGAVTVGGNDLRF